MLAIVLNSERTIQPPQLSPPGGRMKACRERHLCLLCTPLVSP